MNIMIVAGRPSAMKRALIKEVAEAVHRSLDAPIESIRVLIHEVPPEHWGVGGEPKG